MEFYSVCAGPDTRINGKNTKYNLRVIHRIITPSFGAIVARKSYALSDSLLGER